MAERNPTPQSQINPILLVSANEEDTGLSIPIKLLLVKPRGAQCGSEGCLNVCISRSMVSDGRTKYSSLLNEFNNDSHMLFYMYVDLTQFSMN